MSNGPLEPAADLREEFTEQQALVIIGQILAASSGRGDQ
jgi:hypothetical protein